MKITNAKQIPSVLYGLHCCEGVAEYDDPQIKDGAYRILLSEAALKKMDKTFSGRPVYVHHVEKVSMDTLENDVAGYVIESFYNPPDGKHWVKFIVTSDEGHKAISAGWKLSNAYVPKEFAGGGKWHNVDYLKEVMDAEYEHMAIVPNPRYAESIVLTPEEFKAYNSEREAELKAIANSKGEPSMLNLFTKKKIDNALEIETTTVLLKSGSEKTIKQLVNEAEVAEDKKKNEEKAAAEAAGKPVMANEDHMVECNGKVMSVADMKNSYMQMLAEKDSPKKENVESEQDKAALKKDESPAAEKKESAADPALEKKENKEEKPKEDKPKEEEKKENSLWFDALKNAPKIAEEKTVLDLSEDKVARGKSRYGSN